MTDIENAAETPRRRGHITAAPHRKPATTAAISRKRAPATTTSSTPNRALSQATISPQGDDRGQTLNDAQKAVASVAKSARKRRTEATSVPIPRDPLPPSPLTRSGRKAGAAASSTPPPEEDAQQPPIGSDVDARGQNGNDTQSPISAGDLSADNGSATGGHARGATQEIAASRRKTITPATPQELPGLIAEIVGTHRERRAIMLAAGDMQRRIKAQERSAAVARNRAMGIVLDGKRFPPVNDDDRALVLQMFAPFYTCLDVLQEKQSDAEKRLAAMVRRLPIYAWAKEIRGISENSIATLIGEAGDIGFYSNPAKLWKRFGVGIVDGKAQRRTTDAEMAVAMGYNAVRRAQLWVIGENIALRSADPYYRQIYLDRKAYERPRVQTDMHAHKRAMRYAQKRFLRELWRAWRAASHVVTPIPGAPLAEPQRVAA